MLLFNHVARKLPALSQDEKTDGLLEVEEFGIAIAGSGSQVSAYPSNVIRQEATKNARIFNLLNPFNMRPP